MTSSPPPDPLAGIEQATLIETPAGPLEARMLRPGAAVTLADATVARIEQVVARVLVPRPGETDPILQPVRIDAAAFGPGLPRSAVHLLAGTWVRPDPHDLATLPARFLLDGQAVARQRPSDPTSFLELLLDRPGQLLAHGLALGAAAVHDPEDWRRIHAARRGPETGAPTGNIDRVDRRGIAGWVLDTNRPGRPVLLDVRVDGVLAHPLLADLFRDDLERAGLAGGFCAFSAEFAEPLRPDQPHVIEIRAAGTTMPGSPVALDRVPPAQAVLAALLGLGDQPPPDIRLTLAEQLDRALQMRAEGLVSK